MSYNISVEFDDYEYRYHWVKKGIKFLTEGIPYNYRDHRMTDNLGFFTGMKIGRSDERVQFRRMFREDTEFHEGMDEWIDPDSYFTREYGHDNWKMAYDWYDRSINLVERESAPQHSGDMMFFMRRPAQLRNQAGSLQSEYRTNDVIQEIWGTANKEWMEYGQQQIANTRGVVITMEGLTEKDRRLSRLREELDKLTPGVRDEYMQIIREKADLSDEMMAVLKIPVDQRTDEELILARRANARIFNADRSLDIQIALRADANDQQTARVLLEQILMTLSEMRTTSQYSKTVNYEYWKTRTEVEALDVAAAARAALYDASEMKRRSIFDDEYEIDPVTKEKKILQIGAISKYEKAFADWRKILDEYPRLYDGALADDLCESMSDYYQMLKVTGNEWPVDQPLQKLVDYRIDQGETFDELPGSEEIAERESLKEEANMDDPSDATDKGATDKGGLLTKALLTKTLLTKTLLTKTLLTKTLLTKTILTKTILTKTLLTKALLTKTLLTKALLTKALLTKALLTKTLLTKTLLTKTRRPRMTLTRRQTAKSLLAIKIPKPTATRIRPKKKTNQNPSKQLNQSR